MEELNSIKARKLNPVERMQKLQRAILEADGRVKVQRHRVAKVSYFLQLAIAGPIISYLIYNIMHPNG